MSKSSVVLFAFTLFLGVVLGGVGISLWNEKLDAGGTSDSETAERKPLYWVAPMDANYRRDKPGKSPMGMDLVPVYEEDNAGEDNPGAIKISPSVVNNLGVRIAPAFIGTLDTFIETVGYVQYDEERLLHIHSRVDGWIEELYVDAIGDRVKKGQALYSLYSPSLVNAQEEFVLSFKGGDKRLIWSAEERLRALKLSEQSINRLKKTQKVEQNVTFYAGMGGVVEHLGVRRGFYVQPQTTMLSIGDLSKVWVEAQVYERQVSLLKVGQAVTMSLDFLPGRHWQGELAYIYPVLNPTARTVRVKVVFDNGEGLLKPNMFAKLAIDASSTRPRLLVPRHAIIKTAQQERVVVAFGEGQFKSVAVTSGLEDTKNIEILTGLVEGENVVTSAQFLLDSESSKTSDFSRMSPAQRSNKLASVNGKLLEIDVKNQRVKIARGPIEKWGRPADTMEFAVERHIALSDYSPNQDIYFTFEIRDDDFYVVELQRVLRDGETR